MQCYADKARKILSELEKKLVAKYPFEYGGTMHQGEFPKIFYFLDWGRGVSFVN